MSEFTLDIQLTELGFSNWSFPLCEPPSVKETFLPTQNTTEKPTPANCHEDPETAPNPLTNKSFLQDHQYFSPFKSESVCDTETAKSDSSVISTEREDKAICNSWKKAKKREVIEEIDREEEQEEYDEEEDDDDYYDDDDDDDEEEENKKKEIDEKQQKFSEVKRETSSPTMDDVLSEEERTDLNEVEYILTDDDDDAVDNVDDEYEEEEDAMEEEKEEQDEDDDVSWSETNGNEENKENRCHVCDLTFSSLFLLREHLNMHTGVRPYRCDECGKQFCQLVNYRTHLRSHSHKASIHCRVCSILFETEEQLQQHLETNHFEKEFYQCDFCKQIFTNLEVCKDHVEGHRQQAKRHLCLKCGSSFRLRNSLLRHLEWHSRGIFSCSDCERTFSSKASLLRHSFSHLGVLPYTCLKCRRHFRLPSLYHGHECKPESIQCMACLVFFQSQEDFDKHKKDTGCWGHQGPLQTKTDEIRCMECGKVFASVEELKKHGSTHQRVLKCAECGMGFRSAIILMSHMGGHAGQRPCLCKDCGLGFPHQQGYDSHLKTCGVVAPPVATVKKPKRKAAPPQIIKPCASNIIFQHIAQPSNPASFSSGLKEVHMLPQAEKNKNADGRWKLTLNKEPPKGMPLVMFLPVSSTSGPSKNSQTFLPSSMVLETPSTASRVVPISIAPPSTVINKGQANIPQNTLIPVDSHNSVSRTRWTIVEDRGSVQVLKVGEQVKADQGMNTTAKAMESEDKSQSNRKPNVLAKEKTIPESVLNTETVNLTCTVTPLSLIKKDGNNLNETSPERKDSSTPGDELSVPLKRISEEQTLDCSQTSSLVTDSSEKTHLRVSKDKTCFEEVMPSESRIEMTLPEDNKSEYDPQAPDESGFDVEVEIHEDVESSSMEVEIGDEDSGVDMLDGELHECVTCGQVLSERDMVQHYMKHAAVSDVPELSPVNCATHTSQQTPPCSPSRKRLRSGTEL